MAKTCIVCGNAAGSGEHVFPAALGGRRTNRGIYCKPHDNGYSVLVSALARQVDFLNAYLGVRPDHSTEKKTILATDSVTGEPIAISVEGIEFTKPHVISQTPSDTSVEVQMAFPDRQSANQWMKDLESKGFTIERQGKLVEQRYFLGHIHHGRAFGGANGLAAVAYIVQTFFAQAFPEIARSGALTDVIAYTQAATEVAALSRPDGNSPELDVARTKLASAVERLGGLAPVSWDFAPLADVTSNAFGFGHRITVGIDSADAQMYGRLSLFSALHFVARLGTAPHSTSTREITIDIDPLAEHPPNDIVKHERSVAQSRIRTWSADVLANAHADGKPVRALQELLERLIDHQLSSLARDMEKRLEPLSAMPPLERQDLIAAAVDEQSQLVWRMVTYVISGLKEQLKTGGMDQITPMLDKLIAHDATSTNGLSFQAHAMLIIAQAALAAQIENDYAAGLLKPERIAELMGGGAGLGVVGEAVLAPLMGAMGLAH